MISSIWQTFKTLVLGGIVVSMAACGPSSRMNGTLSVSDEFKRKLFTEPDQTVNPTVPEKYQTYEVYRVADVQIGANKDSSAISARVLISSTAGDETVELVGMVRPDGSASLTDISPLSDGKNRLVAEASCLDKGVCKRIIVNIYFSVAGVTHKKQFASAALLAGEAAADGANAGAGSGAVKGAGSGSGADSGANEAKVSTAAEEIKPESQKSEDQAEGDDHEDDVHDSEKELADETDESDRTLGEFAGPTRNEALIGKLFPRTEVPTVLPPQEKQPEKPAAEKAATGNAAPGKATSPGTNPAPTGKHTSANGQTPPAGANRPAVNHGTQPSAAPATRGARTNGTPTREAQTNGAPANRSSQPNAPLASGANRAGKAVKPTGAQTSSAGAQGAQSGTSAAAKPAANKDERSTLERARDWVVSWFKTEESAKPAPKPAAKPAATPKPTPKPTPAQTANRGSTQTNRTGTRAQTPITPTTPVRTTVPTAQPAPKAPPARSTQPAPNVRPAPNGKPAAPSANGAPTRPAANETAKPAQQNTNPSTTSAQNARPPTSNNQVPLPVTPPSNAQPPAPARTAAPAPARTAAPAPARTAAPAPARTAAPAPARTEAPAPTASSQYPFPPATPSPDDEEAEQQIAAHEMKWAPLMNLRDGGVAEGSYSGAGRPAARIRNASQLPDSGRGLNAIRINAGAHFGTGMLVSFLQNAASYLFRELGLSLYVGDMSIRNGGRFGRSHQTHKNGLDADIAYLAINSPLRDSALDSRGRVVENFNFEATWTFLKLAYRQEFVSDAKRVSAISRVFMSHKVKDGFCAWAKKENLLEDEKNVELLRLIRRERGHHKHFHLSLKCSPYYPSCRNLAGPPPVGPGCP